MANFNRVILLGNLTRDVELKYTQSGLAVTEIGLAVNERRKGQSGELVEETVFVDITLWGRTAEIASEYLSKGSQALIEGRLKYDTWEKDGQKRSKLRVVGETLQLLGARNPSGAGGRGSGGATEGTEGGGRGAGSRNGGAAANGAPVGASASQPGDDIPF